MFEQVVTEAASRFGVSTASAWALVRGLLSQMTNEQTGGSDGFRDLFRRAGLGDVLTSWFGGHAGKTISASQLESALGTSTLDALAASSGLKRATAASMLAFVLPKIIGRLTPDGALPSRTALQSQVSKYLKRPVVAVSEPRVAPRTWPGWLPWAAAVLLAVGWLWLRGPAGSIDPQLTLANQDGKVTYSGLVRDDATQTAIVSALRTTFGEANIEGNLRIDPSVRPAAWMPRLGEIIAALKKPGVQLSLNGDAVNLGGWLSAADREALGDTLRGIVGTSATIGSLGDATVEAVRAANDKAMSALRAIGTTGVVPETLVQTMNLAVINFASGSAEIPPDSMEIIRTSAEAIKRAPSGSIIEIGGHTDNTGDPASNLKLSQVRADAVKGALVAGGASASMLTAKGYGDTRPRTTNDTEYGRFQNRRIEYALVTGK
jgi:outer membrane protein OmpA-like peptidoglycan-associated protein/uncharacterized protein YidB (DUF937 family)